MNRLESRPTGWAECRLGDLIEIIRGVSYKKDQASSSDGPGLVPIVRATNIDQQLDFEGLIYVPTSCVSPDQFLRRGDIVVAASSGSKHVVGKAAQLRQDWNGSFGAFCMGIRPSQRVDSAYVAWFLQTEEYRRQVSDLASGSNINNLRRDHIEGIYFRLAPLDEQRRIVAKIEELFSELDAGVAALERVRAGLKRYRAAVLKAAVEGKLTEDWRAQHPDTEPASILLERILTDRRRKWEEAQLAKFAQAGKLPPSEWQRKYGEPAKPKADHLGGLPEGWCWASLSQLGELDRGRSRHRPRNAPHLYGGPYPFIQTGDIRHARTFVRGSTQTYSEGGLEQSRLWPTGTLCITIAANIAETAILGIDACFPDSVVGFLADESHVDTRYIEIYMRTAQSNLERLAPATAQKNINLEVLAALPIVLPPRTEQALIVQEVDRRLSIVDEIEAQVEANLKRAARLRQGILKRAFEGKLVPQDPTDEPAEQLLARIRQGRQSSTASENGKPATRRRGRPRKAGAALPLFSEDDGADEGGES